MQEASPVVSARLTLDRRLTRERSARLQAEAIAEQGLRELFQRQQEIQLLGATADAANAARSVPEAMQSALDAICEYTKWPVGRYFAVKAESADEAHTAVPTDTWHLAGGDPSAESVRDLVSRIERELNLAHRVLENGTAQWIEDVSKEVSRDALADPALGPVPLRAAFALPVLAGREVAAVLEFFAPNITPDRHLLGIFTHIGAQLARVIERERAQAEKIDALRDPLTRLPNRKLFLRFVQRALQRYQRDPRNQFAVLFVDLDGFKAVNDSLGHRTGDALLLQIGRRLAESVRVTDTIGRPASENAVMPQNAVARLGGDEFTVLLEDINQISDPIRVADRIHRALEQPFVLDSAVEVFTSASIGIAGNRPGHRSAEDVLQDADIAMYRAKAGGKRRSEIFDEAMHRRAVERLQLETDLRRAADRGELVLAYQPIMRLDTGALYGFEALVRWRHPTRGVIGPDDFIPLAEDSGAIFEIGEWVLREACAQLRRWQERFRRPDLHMAINLSGKQFSQTDLAERIARVIAATGARPESLCLELTESVAMEHPEQSQQKLSALRELGVDLAIDDFGTGYSSLSYLARFRVNRLKIDRSFVGQLHQREGETLVRAMLSLGSSLGLTPVAEGVETGQQAAHLRSLGCPYAQGFHFHEPLFAESVEALLTRHDNAR